MVAQVVGGLLGGAQTGQGIQKGHGKLDSLFNAAIVASHMFGDKKAPTSYFKNGKLVSDTKALAQSGRGVKRVKRRKKQKGKGFIKDLLKTGAKQALRAAAQTGLDVLDNKRSLKDAIKTHGLRAIKSTAQPLLARGGPKKRPNKKPMKRPMKRPTIKRPQTKRPRPQTKRPRPQTKRPLPKPPIKKSQNKRPPIKRPAIKRPKRALDIFD
jgi:hypothetical protein